MSSGIERVGGDPTLPPRVPRVPKKDPDERGFEDELAEQGESGSRKPKNPGAPGPDRKHPRSSDGETGTQLDVTA